jgi:hypothetical protein
MPSLLSRSPSRPKSSATVTDRGGPGGSTKATGVKNRPSAEFVRNHQNRLLRKVALIPNALPKAFYKGFI